MQFSELVRIDTKPVDPRPAAREAVGTVDLADRLSADPRNNGFVSGLVDRRRGSRLTASRRGFLRSSLVAAAATTAVSVGNLFGPAKRVEAQTGIVGTYPRRIAQYCPSYNSNDNCQPGCGSSPICTDCCTSDGYFRNDPANGYTLYAGGCGDGDIADGWIWRYKGECGRCSTIEYRCSDGYVQTDTGPAPFICRFVTDCVELAEGSTPGPDLVDAARPTNWRPAGALELAVDNGGSVTIRGWIADGSGAPVQMRLTANGQIVSIGAANLARPDIASSVRGAGANTGFSVSIPVEPGQYRFCVDALQGVVTATVGCVTLNVGAGESVRGPGATGSIPQPPDANEPAPSPGPTATPGPTPTPTPPPTLPEQGAPSATPTYGAAQIIRRTSPTTAFVSGWAGDFDAGERALVEVQVDGQPVDLVYTELPRPDVAAALPGVGSSTGFAVTVRVPETETEVCVDAIGSLDGRRNRLGCFLLGAAPADGSTADQADAADDPQQPSASGSATQTSATVFGAVDSLEVIGGELVAKGWAFNPNNRTVAVTVALTHDTGSTTGVADRPHRESLRRYGLLAGAGFQLVLPIEPGPHAATVGAYTDSDGVIILAEDTVIAP